jgi:hypothetical protein
LDIVLELVRQRSSRARSKSARWLSDAAFASPSQTLTATTARTIEAQKRLDVEQWLEPEEVPGLFFPVVAAEFLTWCHSRCYRSKPSTARRISTSLASLTAFFREHTIEQIRPIEIERYKTWRAENFIKDVTLRNDLNALSLFFKYAKKAGWAASNPLIGDDKVKRPSGEDAFASTSFRLTMNGSTSLRSELPTASLTTFMASPS